MSGIAGYAATSPAEFMMIIMKQKENSREAVLGEVGITGMSTGAPDKFIREYSFEKIKPGVYKVVPKVDLVPGEYCFYTHQRISLMKRVNFVECRNDKN